MDSTDSENNSERHDNDSVLHEKNEGDVRNSKMSAPGEVLIQHLSISPLGAPVQMPEQTTAAFDWVPDSQRSDSSHVQVKVDDQRERPR